MQKEEDMNMRHLTILTIAGVFLFTMGAAPADAGSKQRHRWEGVAIGVGAAILGSAIANSMDRPHEVRTVNRGGCYYPPKRYCPPPRHRRGHWETRRLWVPGESKRVWNPGHYNAFKEWVDGHWIEIEETPGHYETRRVWIHHR